jgi:hypothetical protein
VVASNGTGYAYEDDEDFVDYDSEMDYDGEGFGAFFLAALTLASIAS